MKHKKFALFGDIKDFEGKIAIGDTVEFEGDPNYYGVVAINEDGIMVLKVGRKNTRNE